MNAINNYNNEYKRQNNFFDKLNKIRNGEASHD